MVWVPKGKKIDRVAATVVALDSGYLYCESCGGAWCSHIEATIRAFLDANSIMNHALRVEFIFVPILPTENIFARVWLMPVASRRRFLAKAYLQSPEKSDPGSVCTGDDQFITFLSCGEGRYALRVAILDLLAPSFEIGVSCGSLGHTWDVNIKAEELHLSGTRGKLLNTWCSMWYKKCYICYNREGVGIEFDKDLIPDYKPSAPIRFPPPERRPKSRR